MGADADLDQALAERDEAQEWADRLAYAIAPQEVIGEHSSANNPWANALGHAPGWQSEADVLNRAADAVEADCSHSSDACFCGSASWLRARAALAPVDGGGENDD